MEETKDRLFDLLPTVHRQRDAKQGWPLRALLQVIAEQADVVEKDIDQLYDNWFIETCQDWVVPYIADLVGFEPVHESGQPGEVTTEQSRLRNKILIPRQEVANTIRNRRRKGTLALLELISRDVANWPARAVEFYRLLSFTQHLNHLRLDRGRTVSLRRGDVLDRIDGPFDETAHSVEIRRASSTLTQGRYNIPNIGLFVWRLRSFSITQAQAHHLDSNPNRYTFSTLKNNIPLFTRPIPEDDPTQIADEFNVPVPIKLGVFKEHLDKFYGEKKSLQLWTGKNCPEEPTLIEQIVPADLSDWDNRENLPPKKKQADDLEKVAVDPQLGRIAYAPGEGPGKNENVWVLYHYGFPADIGGGEYSRPISQITPYTLGTLELQESDLKSPEKLTSILMKKSDILMVHLRKALSLPDPGPDDAPQISAADLTDKLNRLLKGKSIYDEKYFKKVSLSDEVQLLMQQNPTGNTLAYLNRQLLEQVFPQDMSKCFAIYRVGLVKDPTNNGIELFETITDAITRWQEEEPKHAVIEIIDNREYVEQINVHVKEKRSLQIRAANRKRPAIRMVNLKGGGPDALCVSGETGSRFILDGLLISGRGLQIENDLAELSLRHTTLVPGWELENNGEPDNPGAPSLYLLNTTARVKISHSILGSILVEVDEVKADPIQILIRDSIVDSTELQREDETEPERKAIMAQENRHANAVLTILRSTIIGTIRVHEIDLVENSILYNCTQVARRQSGCIRFSYVAPHPETRTPRRYNCQPDLVKKVVQAKVERGEIPANRKQSTEAREEKRVRPRFNSVRYGTPNYLQLANSAADEIKRGADDESEMGVYHDLFQPQRETNLRIRLDEYTPAGMDAGIFFAS